MEPQGPLAVRKHEGRFAADNKRFVDAVGGGNGPAEGDDRRAVHGFPGDKHRVVGGVHLGLNFTHIELSLPRHRDPQVTYQLDLGYTEHARDHWRFEVGVNRALHPNAKLLNWNQVYAGVARKDSYRLNGFFSRVGITKHGGYFPKALFP